MHPFGCIPFLIQGGAIMEKKLLYKAVWSFHKSTRIEYDEVLGIAGIAYSEALQGHDPSKGCFSTYFWRCMRNAIVDYQRRNPVHDTQFDETFISPNKRNPEMDVEFLNVLENMEVHARKICKLVISSSEIAELIGKPKLAKGKIKRELRKQGWKWQDIWDGFNEIQNALKQTI